MRLVYRVLRKPYARTPFDGEGSYQFGGRWSSPGVRLAYASEHQSLAMLEYFVHLDKDDSPEDLVLAIAEIPDDLTRESLEEKDLPRNWRGAVPPPDLARFGDEFAARSDHCVLLVPSALVPRESNCLINPGHSDFTAILFRETEPLDYDPRMFREYPRGRSKAR